MSKDRIWYIEFIRIISCFLVIVNHTSDFRLWSTPPAWVFGATYFFISKPAVPLFIMVSGALLLGKEESYRDCAKRVFRIIIVLLLFSGIYAPRGGGEGAIVFLSNLMKSHVTNSYWYLYLYAGLLLMLPLLRKLVKNLVNIDYCYIIAITVIFPGILPIISHYFPQIAISGLVFLPFFSCYVGLFVTGYYCHKVVVPSRHKVTLAVIVNLLLLTVQVVGTYYEYLKNNMDFLFYDNRTFATITLGAINIFYICKYAVSNVSLSPFSAKTIQTIGSCTFGIYLLSDFFIDKLNFVSTFLMLWTHPLFAMVVFQVFVFSAGLFVTYFLKKIPMVNKYL